MRAIMSCRTGPVPRAAVERVLAAMGWCPDHPDGSPYLHRRHADLVDRLPEAVRADLTACDPLLITTFPNVWGFASFDRVVPGHRCEFDPHVEIRRFDGNALVARGVVKETGRIRFRRYVWSVRRRERVVLLALAGLCVLSIGTALLLYLRFPTGDGAYLRGYLDRLSSAVQTAAVIMGVNLVFEYRDWKGSKAVIEWSPPAA